jgi:hypothetical protein
MKGQIDVAPETIINALSFILVTISIIGVLLQFQQYYVTYDQRVNDRQLIDFMEVFLSSNCVAYEEGGTVFKGILDPSKLNSYSSCIPQINKNVYIKIEDGKGNKWGNIPQTKTSFLRYPAVVKYQDEIVPAILEVGMYK